MFRYYNASLEDQFVVVNWDQRGAGRSFSADIDWHELTEERLLQDAHELTGMLRTRFGGRLILAGHSWGSHLGMLLAARHPEDYAAYVGIGQVADQARSEALSFDAVLARAVALDRRDAIGALQAVGPPDESGTYRGGLRGFGVQRRWVREFGGAAQGKDNIGALLVFGWPLLVFEAYGVTHKLNYLQAEANSMLALEDDLLGVNLTTEVPRLCVPLFVFQGSDDLQTVTALTRLVLRCHRGAAQGMGGVPAIRPSCALRGTGTLSP